MLRSLVVMLALVVAVGAAHADTTAPDPAAVTDAARAKVARTEKRRAALASAQAQLQASYQDQLAQIDSLKQQKASWRRDRQLKGALASSLDTANKLAQAGADISQMDARLLAQRKALLAAIDAEVAAGATGDRAKLLTSLRAKVDALVSPPKKIVIPDDEIDPLADPDELDQQAQALRASEAELEKQVDSLDDDATRFTKQANLKKAHERAGVMASRDDDQPRRTSGSGGEGGATNADNNPSPSPEQTGSDPPAGDFHGDPAIVLSDVVDSDTEDSLRKAEQSTDPTAKAAAAAKARDAVAKRLAALKKRRQEIEDRAKALRQ